MVQRLVRLGPPGTQARWQPPSLCCGGDAGLQAVTGAVAGGASRGGRGVLDSGHVRAYGDVSSRLIALLLDAVFLTAIIFVAAVVVSLLIGPAVELDAGAESLDDGVTLDRSVAVVNAIVSLLLSAAYFTGAWALRRGTPGQRLLRMEVLTADRGDTVTLRVALVRWALLGAPLASWHSL